MHDSHYHKLTADAEMMVEAPGTALACPVCSPGRIPLSPTPVSPVPAYLADPKNLASHAVNVPVSRRSAAKK